MTYVFYLDRYHLGDPLFLNRFARDLGRLAAPRLVVHGPGDDAELALEADGTLVRWQAGVPAVSTPHERAVVERVTRDVGRRLTHTMNDAGLSAVRLDGASRGLLRPTDDGYALGSTDWLIQLAQQGAIPVVAALAPADEGMQPVPGGVLAGHLAGRFEAARVVLFGRGLRTGIADAGEAVALDAVPPNTLPEPDVVPLLLSLGADVLLTGSAGIGAEGVLGTRVLAG